MHLLILASIFPTHSENLSARYPNIKITYALPSNVTKEQLEQADAVFGNPPLSLLRQLRQFPKWIHLESAGADAYTKPGILPQDTLLTNSTGAYGPAIAEHALGMLFGISKKLFLYRDEQLRASWNDLGTVKPITGTTTEQAHQNPTASTNSTTRKLLTVFFHLLIRFSSAFRTPRKHTI